MQSKILQYFGLQDKASAKTTLDNFFYSLHYPALVALIAVVSFITNMQMGGYAVYLILASVLLVRQRDATPILPLLVFFITLFRDLSVTSHLLFYLMLIPLAVCLVIHFIKFPPIPFCPGKLFLPLLAVSTALFAGGLLSPYLSDYSKGLLYIIPLGPGLTIIYLFFNNYVRPPENFDTKQYLCILLVLLGMICCIQFSYYFLECKVLKSDVFEPPELGWSNVNGLASLLLLAIPASCYLLVKSKNVVSWSAMVALFYVAILLTKCDGALGVSVAYLPFMAFFVYRRLPKSSKKTFSNVLFLASLLACLCGIMLEKTGNFQPLVDKLLHAFEDDHGRSPLYRNAVNVFIKNPIFGGGMGYYNDFAYESGVALRNFNFHSTFFTVIGCMGSAGLLAYFYYFFARYRLITERNTSFNLFIFFAFTMFENHGFVDTCEFSTIPQMIVITLIILITDLTNIKGNDTSLPLVLL